MEAATLFTREGEAKAATGADDKGRPTYMRQRLCSRCGGAGRSDKWARTGYTCFECGGSGQSVHGPKCERLYTTDELAKLNARRDKAQAKKQAACAAKAEAERVAAEARREAFEAEYADFFALAAQYAPRSEFIADVISRAHDRADITPSQYDAVLASIEKIKAADAKRQASEWIGREGDRVALSAVVERVHYIGVDNWGHTRLVVSLRTTDGCALTHFGNPNWLRGHFDRVEDGFVYDTGYAVELKATVKGHTEYRGEKQTVIARPTPCELAKAA